jgi:hypothetical protein
LNQAAELQATTDLLFPPRAPQNERMKMRVLFASAVTILLATRLCSAAGNDSWVGQYTDKKYLGGRAVFQLTIEQSGGAMQVSFDAAWADGHGAAPEAQGAAKVSGDTLTFKFEDTFKNSGTGTITRAGNDIVVTINPTHVADPRCLAFYGKHIALKRTGK